MPNIEELMPGMRNIWLSNFGVELSTVPDRDATLILRFRGSFDGNVAPFLIEGLNPQVLEQTRILVVDLADTTFLATEGLAILSKLHVAMESWGGRMVIVNPAEQATDTIGSLGLDRVLHIGQR